MEKKDGKNYEVLKFFETLILIVLIGTAVMIVFEVFSDQMNGEDEEYEDYDYVDYSYDYYEDDYDEYDNYYSNLNNNNENTSVSNFVSIEDFMNSEEGKAFLEKSNQNFVNSNEIEKQNVVSNEVEDTVTDYISDTDVSYEHYETQDDRKEKFEIQRKNIEITDEGRSLNDEIMVSIKNNNEDFLYDITLNTIFFKDDKIAYVDVQDVNIIDANNKKYVKVLEIPEEFDNYQFLISKKSFMKYNNELLNDNLSFSSKKLRNSVEINMQNKSKRSIDKVYFTILYFDNVGKLVDFEEVYKYNINSNKTTTLEGAGVWDNKNIKYYDFAHYEVILDYAESYK